jgi:magnesium chelatase family protein
MARPGEISLASHGVLFTDELPEFNREALDALREPLEENVVTVGRVAGTFTYSTNFLFITDSHAAKGGAIENENGYTGNSYP